MEIILVRTIYGSDQSVIDRFHCTGKVFQLNPLKYNMNTEFPKVRSRIVLCVLGEI